ncbi:MAG: cell division protein FtsW [Geminicoccaceae bacterium]|nr:cell division protein FtsW [Geminicoccaceae bacterium]MCB9943807.1 cell division protein FtsW [Geminicoccaceae bacterium]
MTPFARHDRSFVGRWWWTVDHFVLGGIIVLAILGLFMVFAASPPVARKLGYPETHFIFKHLISLGISLGLLFLVSLMAPRGVLRLAVVCFAVFGLLTIATLFLAPEVKGSHRWLRMFGQQIQPTEFLKPCVTVIGAWLLARSEGIRGLVPATLLVGGVVGVLLMQPDVGMAALITLIFCAQLFIAGLSWLFVGIAVTVGVVGLYGAYALHPHVQERVDIFFGPVAEYDQIGIAMRALSSGGLFGRGPGEGVVKFSLPEAHSDFVFVTAAEEFGILFCLLIVLVFAVVVLKALHRTQDSNDRFVRLAAFGLAAELGLQALINMAVNLNLMPTKGMTLPLISYGGSSMMALGIGLGMLLAFTRRGARLGGVP